MKKVYFFLIAIVVCVFVILVFAFEQSGDLIAIKSGTAEDTSKKWVLAEDDCKNPDVFCNQVYAEESEVEEYLKNKEESKQKELHAATVVAPSKAEAYQQLIRYFNNQDTTEMIPVIIQYANLGSIISFPQKNENIGESILAGLDMSSYKFDSYDRLKDGVILIRVNKEALTYFFKNDSVLMIADPTAIKVHLEVAPNI